MHKHVVAQGECIATISHRFGFHDHCEIWNAAQNSKLKQSRRDPHILHPGDIVIIPNKKQKQESRSTDSAHTFVVPAPKRPLKICLKDEHGKPMAHERYVLVLEEIVFKSVTDEAGCLSHWIPIAAREGELHTEEHIWPVHIAMLNPMERASDRGISGVQARLRNLGYHSGHVDSALDELTEAAIRSFLLDQGHTVEDRCEPGSESFQKLIDALYREHGC